MPRPAPSTAWEPPISRGSQRATRIDTRALAAVALTSILVACGGQSPPPASSSSVAEPAPASGATSASAPLAPATGLRVTFLGTGAPRPSFDRYGPSILVEAGEQRILVDPSSGLRERLLQAGGFELITGIDHVLVTHLHYDHTIGLPDLWLTGWLYGRRTPLVVEGPVGTVAMMRHLEEAFAWDTRYRILVGVPGAGVGIEPRDVSAGVVFERDGLKVTAFEAEHMPIDLKTRQRLPFEGQTFGYRFDYHGRSLVLSGDTRASDTVAEVARGVDVLVHEVQVPSPNETEEAKLANVSLSVHAEPRDVASVFARARPRMAVYSHIIPPEVTEAELRAATPYDGPLAVAYDLMMITIGERIDITDRPSAVVRAFEQSGAVR